MKHHLSIGLVAALVGLLASATPIQAQRIDIEESATDTEAQQPETGERPTSSSRIIPPEEFGKYRDQKQEQSELSKDALIEKLRADSASMRIRFKETMRELRADSKAMRKKLQQLRRKNRRLTRELKRLEGSDTARPDRTDLDEPDTPLEPTVRSTDSAETPGEKPATDQDTETDRSGSEETLPDSAKLNPNTASLSDLKSISDLSDRLAERIEWYRREVRPFESRNDLRRVPGIDRKLFDRIKQYFHEGPY